MLALRMRNRIVILSKPEFYSYKLEKVMKKYEFKEMTRAEVELRKKLRAEEDKEKIKSLKVEIKAIKLEPVEFLNKKDLVLFLADTLKNGDPNE